MGDPLTAYFDEMGGYEFNGVVGETYYIPTGCYLDPDYEPGLDEEEYDARYGDAVVNYTGDVNNEGSFGYVNYNGIEYDECYLFFEFEIDGWVDRQVTDAFTFHYLVPVGYDGNIIIAYNSTSLNDIEEGEDYSFFDLIDGDELDIRIQ